MRMRPMVAIGVALAVMAGAFATIKWLDVARPALPVDRSAYRALPWRELMPAGWNPLQRYRDQNIASLGDGDPRVAQMMRELRDLWDNAPTVDALDRAPVQLTGYVVPIESGKEGVTEFLLVPYFGACIHSPPPPANQIVDVVLTQPQRLRSMDTVRVYGALTISRQDTQMGRSGYRMHAAIVEPHREP